MLRCAAQALGVGPPRGPADPLFGWSAAIAARVPKVEPDLPNADNDAVSPGNHGQDPAAAVKLFWTGFGSTLLIDDEPVTLAGQRLAPKGLLRPHAERVRNPRDLRWARRDCDDKRTSFLCARAVQEMRKIPSTHVLTALTGALNPRICRCFRGSSSPPSAASPCTVRK